VLYSLNQIWSSGMLANKQLYLVVVLKLSTRWLLMLMLKLYGCGLCLEI
jgi:hypothetical protein